MKIIVLSHYHFDETMKKMNLNDENVENAYIKVAASGGSGVIYNPRINSKNDNDTYKDYVVSP